MSVSAEERISGSSSEEEMRITDKSKAKRKKNEWSASNEEPSRIRKPPERFTLDFSAASEYGRPDTEIKKKPRISRKLSTQRKKLSFPSSSSFLFSKTATDLESNLNSAFVHEQLLLRRVFDQCERDADGFIMLGGRCLDHNRSFPPLSDKEIEHTEQQPSKAQKLFSTIEELSSLDWKQATEANQKAVADHELYPLQVSLHGPVAVEQPSNGHSHPHSSHYISENGEKSKKTREFYYLLPQPYSLYNHYYYSYPSEENNSDGPSEETNNSSTHTTAPANHPSTSLFEMPCFVESHLLGNSLPIKVHFFPLSISEMTGQRSVGYLFFYQRREEGYFVFFLHNGTVQCEAKQPFELEIGIMNEEDEIVIAQLAKSLFEG